MFGSDFGVFSLAAKAARLTVAHATNTNGSLQIYVHNKTIIVDGRLVLCRIGEP